MRRDASVRLYASLLPLRFEMSSLKEMQSIDREPFSELVESPINPAFLHMSTPSRTECNPMFHLQINGEAVWQLQKLSGNPNKVFDALQDNLLKIGYKLSSSSSVRVGIAVNSRVGYIVKKIRNVTSGKDRYAMRSGYWCSVALQPEEIVQGPTEVINELKKREKELINENQKLSEELEGKILHLLNQNLALFTGSFSMSIGLSISLQLAFVWKS